jgi:DNA replication protein DnaC
MTTKKAANAGSLTSAATAEVGKQIDYLARALKAPRIREAAARLGDQARDAGWSHEEYLAAVLDREVAARDASGAQLRTRAAGFGTIKTIEDFVFDHQPDLKRDRPPRHRVLFATATDSVTRLKAAHSAGAATEQLARLRRYGLLIVYEVGYIPFEEDAANLFFQLVSSRYVHASLILTSNLPFAAGETSSANKSSPQP